MNIGPIARLKRIAALEVAQARLLARRPVRLLRDQALVYDCCGRLLSTGDEVTMPRGLAVGLRQIGDAVIISNPEAAAC